MTFTGFNDTDFNVFSINGLDERMEGLKSIIRPKFEALGTHFAPTLSALSGDEMFTHIAKHARRSVNPPNDTWVAFATNKRGYKMLPHFQIGLWGTHVFAWFALIYEAPMKAEYGRLLQENWSEIRAKIPGDFVWSIDHMKPEVLKQSELSDDEFQAMFTRLQTVKKAELLCGITINKEDSAKMSGDEFIEKIERTFEALMPLYKLSQEASLANV
ncbi:YktB family protein [Metabacillus fastidiosus]|uniref:YktB family protein n=1 Tax=Metabacillus fastidiosus TaxID=1458 RepID=UPI003D2A6A81